MPAHDKCGFDSRSFTEDWCEGMRFESVKWLLVSQKVWLARLISRSAKSGRQGIFAENKP